MEIDLKKFREKAGFSQKQLADVTGEKKQHINNMEKGIRKASFEKWKKIMNALGYDIQIIIKKVKK